MLGNLICFKRRLLHLVTLTEELMLIYTENWESTVMLAFKRRKEGQMPVRYVMVSNDDSILLLIHPHPAITFRKHT